MPQRFPNGQFTSVKFQQKGSHPARGASKTTFIHKLVYLQIAQHRSTVNVRAHSDAVMGEVDACERGHAGTLVRKSRHEVVGQVEVGERGEGGGVRAKGVDDIVCGSQGQQARQGADLGRGDG